MAITRLLPAGHALSSAQTKLLPILDNALNPRVANRLPNADTIVGPPRITGLIDNFNTFFQNFANPPQNYDLTKAYLDLKTQVSQGCNVKTFEQVEKDILENFAPFNPIHARYIIAREELRRATADATYRQDLRNIAKALLDLVDEHRKQTMVTNSQAALDPNQARLENNLTELFTHLRSGIQNPANPVNVQNLQAMQKKLPKEHNSYRGANSIIGGLFSIFFGLVVASAMAFFLIISKGTMWPLAIFLGVFSVGLIGAGIAAIATRPKPDAQDQRVINIRSQLRLFTQTMQRPQAPVPVPNPVPPGNPPPYNRP